MKLNPAFFLFWGGVGILAYIWFGPFGLAIAMIVVAIMS